MALKMLKQAVGEEGGTRENEWGATRGPFRFMVNTVKFTFRS